MEKIINQEFGGERPLYCRHDLYLENVKIHAGESALKETGNITAVHCQFEGKYPFWECDGFVIKDSLLTVGAARASGTQGTARSMTRSSTLRRPSGEWTASS